jgi:predicted CoA-binding protein
MTIPQCELPNHNPPSGELLDILRQFRKIAVVGISPKESRDSHRVAKYLIQQGYEVVPVNPGQKEILGRTCYKSLRDIPFPVDIANLFLNPKRVAAVVDQAIERGIPVIWMQLGVVDNQAAARAREAGIRVVMNRCIMTEHPEYGK